MQPVPPTQNNWQARRAWDDGVAAAFLEVGAFFNPDSLQLEIEMHQQQVEKAAKTRKPISDDQSRLA